MRQMSTCIFFLSRTEDPAKAATCARDRRALQQLALYVRVKHSDLTYISAVELLCSIHPILLLLLLLLYF